MKRLFYINKLLEREEQKMLRLLQGFRSFLIGLKGEERPTIRQVEMKLEDVQGSKVNSHINRTSRNSDPSVHWHVGSKGEGTRHYSLEKEFTQSPEIPG
jgi:hypothetical protein